MGSRGVNPTSCHFTIFGEGVQLFKALKYIVYLNTMSPPENRTMTNIADKHHLNLSEPFPHGEVGDGGTLP